jgi:hypothetical protein
MANRINRIRVLGNGVVPMQAREAFKRLMGINNTAQTAKNENTN